MNLTETIISFFVASAAIATPVLVAQTPLPKAVNSVQPSPPTLTLPALPAPTTASERIKVKVSISALEDLKVRQGDSITKGQIIADRTRERSRLLTAKREFEATLRQILNTVIPKPPEPKPVPAIGSLPEAIYIEEEAQIASAELRKMQANRDYNYWLKILSSEPVTEVASVEKARVERDKKLKEIQNQQTKIELVEQLANLPKAVLEHESEVLARLKTELDQAEYSLRLEQGKLVDSGDRNKERLQQLSIRVEQSKADLLLSKTRLETAKSKRRELEYQHAERKRYAIVQENETNSFYAGQMQKYEQDLQSQRFQVSQLREKINFVDNQLAQLSNVRSPINGRVRRIKNLGQNNNLIDLELTIISGDSTSTNPFASPAPSTSTTPDKAEPIKPEPGTSDWGD